MQGLSSTAFLMIIIVINVAIGLIWTFPIVPTQVVIVRAIFQNSLDTLYIMGAFAAASILLIILCEMGLVALVNFLARDMFSSKRMPLALSVEIPRILTILIIMVFYSLSSAAIAFVLASITGSINYAISRRQWDGISPQEIQESLFSISTYYSRLSIGFAVLIIFFFGSFLVLDGSLTVGQLIALTCLDLLLGNFAIDLSSAVLKIQSM
ncbi:MAG: hypothetical protein QNJ46_07425 [Leptolyngbyaceae cyanobacterium MO_188.B28]|nr:hypothetical protein [Leptolyngbyaceae cyanobacterium MO_188.B28]